MQIVLKSCATVPKVIVCHLAHDSTCPTARPCGPCPLHVPLRFHAHASLHSRLHSLCACVHPPFSCAIHQLYETRHLATRETPIVGRTACHVCPLIDDVMHPLSSHRDDSYPADATTLPVFALHDALIDARLDVPAGSQRSTTDRGTGRQRSTHDRGVKGDTSGKTREGHEEEEDDVESFPGMPCGSGDTRCTTRNATVARVTTGISTQRAPPSA
eukprot:1429776-Prymnesium_polylepis.1